MASLPQDVPPRKRRRTENHQSTADIPTENPVDPELSLKHPRRSPTPPATEDPPGRADSPDDVISYWAREGQWPREYFEMEGVLARKRSLVYLGRKRSNSAASTTPSDQRPREEKSAPYRDARYETLLATKGSFLDASDLDITEESEKACAALLSTEQPVPTDSLFRDDLFKQTCRRVAKRNETRVLRDITPLIVPSAEVLAIYGATSLNCLVECLNEGWNNSLPLTGTRPQPDYSVGFRREAFTEVQLVKLSPLIGDFIAGDLSLFMATYYMYFPFLTCEVKCGAGGLEVADRQNAHSMTLAVRAIVELFRVVGREREVDRQILAFSVSHDNRFAKIYGHYPVIGAKDTKYYRHTLRSFDFVDLDGKEKWTAYRFVRNVYETWMPAHFARICSAVEQVPAYQVTASSQSGATGLSQNLAAQHLASDDAASSAAGPSREPDTGGEATTPGTSFTGPAPAKRRRSPVKKA